MRFLKHLPIKIFEIKTIKMFFFLTRVRYKMDRRIYSKLCPKTNFSYSLSVSVKYTSKKKLSQHFVNISEKNYSPICP